MDATTFNAELSKYKVIRKPDYYRIRMNHNTQFKSLGKVSAFCALYET